MALIQPVKYCSQCGTKLEIRLAFGEDRPCCPNCGYIHFYDPKVAVAVFIEQNGEVLLIKRGVDPEKGKWALPAGYVNADEDPRDSAVREVSEETGLTTEITRLVDVYYGTHRPGASIVIVYAAAIIGGTLHPSDDAEEADWFTPDALPELAFASTKNLIARWAQTLPAHP